MTIKEFFFNATVVLLVVAFFYWLMVYLAKPTKRVKDYERQQSLIEQMNFQKKWQQEPLENVCLLGFEEPYEVREAKKRVWKDIQERAMEEEFNQCVIDSFKNRSEFDSLTPSIPTENEKFHRKPKYLSMERLHRVKQEYLLAGDTTLKDGLWYKHNGNAWELIYNYN